MIVKDLFDLNDDFRNCKLIVGKNGLDKEIKKVEIMEVPDGAFWAKENSMIITMGYSLKKNDITTDSLVQMLIDKKVSALGIKLGRYIDEIPQRVLEYADKNNFPIINIPINMSYDQLISPINQKLMDSGSYEIFVIKELKKELRNIIRHDYSLESIINLLTSYTNRKAAILWADSCNFIAGNYADRLEALSDAIKKNIKSIYECNEERVITVDEKNFRVFKIETVNSLQALLCLEQEQGDSFSNTDYEIIYELIPAITIYLLSNNEMILGDYKSNEELYFNALLGQYRSNELKLNVDASFFNISIEKSRFCIVLRMKDNIDPKELLHVAGNILDENGNNFFLRIKDNKLIIIAEIQKPTTNSRHLEGMIATVRDKLLAVFPYNEFFIGISNVCNSLVNLHYTFHEANFALKMGRKLYPNKNIYFYEDYMVYHLLSEISGHPTISKIYKNTIERIKKYDSNYEQECLKTLYALVENDFGIGQTSKSLFIHRNTLYKRIKKINSILNFDMNKSDNRLLIQLALKIDKMLL